MLHLEGCNLSGAQIDLDCQRHVSSRLIHGGIKAVKSNFYDAKLTDLDLQGSKFEFCDLRAADLARSNFSYAVFAGSNLNGTRIKGASLASANIGHADIEELDLGDAMTIDDLTISVDQRDRVLRHFMINVISA